MRRKDVTMKKWKGRHWLLLVFALGLFHVGVQIGVKRQLVVDASKAHLNWQR
jgi:hypothetical protein